MNGIFDFAVPGGGFGDFNGCSQMEGWEVYTPSGPCDPNTTVCNAIDREGIHWAIRYPVAGSFGSGCYDKWEDHPNAEDSGKPFSININFASI